ncbi:MAG TPA: Nif3-like dinuclear metal center hexameric protein [Anaerolineae bacterium]|nr:Nif3-like dinuclear metal center hexameric protein [Anaerolineae bacterium]
MTIQAFINRLKTSLGVAWRETAIDDFLYGNPNDELKNVAVTMMATQAVLEEAVRRDCNLIITHEPLFYNHHHQFQSLLNDPVYLAKEAYLREHRLCVFHLHDNLHHPRLDYIALGMAHRLHWEAYRTDETFKAFKMPGVTLGQMIGELEAALEPAALKYIGDKDVAYDNVLTSWGFMMMENGVKLLNRYENCVLITGETHEWELVEYVHDAHQMGLRKALIMTGHMVSEESGVEFFCNYLQGKSPSRAISYIKTNDLFKK